MVETRRGVYPKTLKLSSSKRCRRRRSKCSDLNQDVLAEILNRLGLSDFIRFTAVCRSWRSVPQTIPCCRPKRETPWLVLSTASTAADCCSFYPFVASSSLHRHRLHRYDFHLPQISGRSFVGSSEGFIITESRLFFFSLNISAINPLTRTQLHFPDFPYSSCFCHKVVISPSLDKVVALFHQYGYGHGRGIEFVWARPGDVSWTPLRIPPNSYIQDFIFHKGRLYCFDDLRSLSIIDLDNGSQSRFKAPTGGRNYLVVSPVRDEYLLLAKYYEGGAGGRFKVFRLDDSDSDDLHWDELRDLGETALFCGGGSTCSFSLSTAEFSSLKRNHIYFNGPWGCSSDNDSGIYDLRDFSIQPLITKRPGNDDNELLGFHRLAWFSPTL